MRNLTRVIAELNLSKKQKQLLKVILYQLDWISILSEAVKMRRTSWGADPVWEWRNASDEVLGAVSRALTEQGLLLTLREEVGFMDNGSQDQRAYRVSVPDIKSLRKEIDAIKNEVKKLADTRPAKGGAELTLSFRALQQAKHWLGEALGELGNELPAEFADKA